MPFPGAAGLRLLLPAAAALLAGCGGLPIPYADHGPKNLVLAPTRTSSSLLVSRRVSMDIYRDARPGQASGQAAYLGTVQLTGTVQHLGLPVGQPLLLLIAFQESPLVGAKVDSTRRVPLTIRPGERYRLVTEYVDSGFDYRLDRVP